MSRDDAKNQIARCSFCGKSEAMVHKLIEGPGVFICDECIALCNDLIERSSRGPKKPAQASDIVLPKPAEIKEKLDEYVIGQDEESCTVYGMPKAIAETGAVDEVVTLRKIADAITKHVGVL